MYIQVILPLYRHQVIQLMFHQLHISQWLLQVTQLLFPALRTRLLLQLAIQLLCLRPAIRPTYHPLGTQEQLFPAQPTKLGIKMPHQLFIPR